MVDDKTFGEVQFPKIIEAYKIKIKTYEELMKLIEHTIRDLKTDNEMYERFVNEIRKK